MRINRFARPGVAGIFFYGRTAAMAKRGARNGKMQSKRWREIRARKFSPQKLAEIDRAVAKELWVAEAQRRADDLATGNVACVPVESALKITRAKLTNFRCC